MKLRKSSQEGIWNVYDGDELMGVVSIDTLESDFEFFTKVAAKKAERAALDRFEGMMKKNGLMK